jgi:hypothetical protein
MARPHKVDSNRGVQPNKPSYFTKLPPVCTRPVPEWPLQVAPRPHEKEYWNTLWKSPQAEIWHQTRCYIIVARYCIYLVKLTTENGGSASELGELRQMEDRLALSPKSMYALYLTVDEETEVVEYPTELGEVQKSRLSRRPQVFQG